DDLWLNEAFAEWIAHKAVSNLAPDLDAWTKFRQRASGALATDSLDRTHAIYHPIGTPKEAAEMFDAITYGKGSAVLRMMEAFLGESAFRAGLRGYMQAFRFGNAKGADLWRHLGDESGQDVEGIMGDWIRQPGHPAIEAAWDAGSGTLRVRQARSRGSPLAAGGPERWRVPLVIAYGDDTGRHVVRHLLGKDEENVPLPVVGVLRWVWPNADDVGFYRCLTDDRLWEGLVQNAKELTNAERIAVMRDLWFQVRNGTRTPLEVLPLVARLVDGEAGYEVLQVQAALWRDVERILEAGAPRFLPPFRAWVAQSYAKSYRRLGLRGRPGESAPDRMRRALLVRLVAGIGRSPKAVADTLKVAARERKDAAGVDGNLAGQAVAVEAITGNAATLKLHLSTALSRRDAGRSPQEVERYLYVLPAFRAPRQVEGVLEALLSGEVAAQAVGPILRALLVEPHSQKLAWRFLVRHWKKVSAQLGEAWIANLVEASGELPGNLARDVEAFWARQRKGRAEQAWGRARERLAEKAEFLARVTPDVARWAATLS
ncbi:MAG: ERAP1-like C-terminal domain-containing protein, partial [Thermoplasmatota archaeon]